jgi:UDP-glucose 4-epimerase
MASRGSVIPLFVNQIQRGVPLTVTDPEMTRFMMTLDDAVDLVLYAFQNGQSGDIFVQKAPAVTIEILIKTVLGLMGAPNHPVNIIGTRHGEKLYETLLSREELVAAQDFGNYYRVPPDFRDLNYDQYVEHGEKKISSAVDYNSHNSERLNMHDMENLLITLGDLKALGDNAGTNPG